MAKKKIDHTEEKIEGIESALSRTEKYIEENQKSLTIIVLAISIIVIGFTLYKKYIVGPAEIEAQSQMYVAEQYFVADSFNLALYGDGNNLGFIDIIEDCINNIDSKLQQESHFAKQMTNWNNR